MTFKFPELAPQKLATRSQTNGSDTALQHADGSTLQFEQAYTDALRWADALEKHGANRFQMKPSECSSYS